MSNIISAADIPALFLNDVPLLDVRAPVEFARGAFPASQNLPLLNDAERTAVGVVYKKAGQESAIALGHNLIAGDHKAGRITAWKDFFAAHPDAVLYCYRGGLRSEIVQQWLAESGLEIPRIAGGYKRMRRQLLQVIENTAGLDNLLIVAGKTGSGKTHLIRALQNSIDLEGLANHRGSAFGTRVHGQPTQINFENALAIALMKTAERQPRRLFVEDESRAIGSLALPQSLYGKMMEAPIALLEEPLEQRADTILRDYILSNYLEFRNMYPRNYAEKFAEYLLSSLGKIRRRLGDENYGVLKSSMEEALQNDDNLEAHREWIRLLLQKYYDPMYEYQIGKKSSRVVFRGNRDELLRWASPLDVQLQAVNA